MSSPGPLILLVEDEPQMRRFLRVSLEGSGYRYLEAGSGQEGLSLAAQHRPEAILLDLGLPDMEGVAVLRRLREWSNVPVLILSVRDREDDKIAALDGGADDYITKPFGRGELLARLRAARRKTLGPADTLVFHTGDLQVDLTARVVTLRGKEVKLTATEYSLLRLFARNAGKVLTHQHILREVWGPNQISQTHYLRVYVAHLREKLEENPAQPKLIVTESAVGYRLVEQE